MPVGRTAYRGLHGYKYQLVEDYRVDLEETFDGDIKTPYVSFGWLFSQPPAGESRQIHPLPPGET